MSSCCEKIIACLVFAAILIGIVVFAFINIFNPAVLGGIQAQLDDAEVTILPNGDNVIFNTVLNDQSPNIDYDTTTGEFTITQPGNYLVNWWVAVDGAGPATTISFAVALNNIPYSIASSPIVSDQLSGDALVTVAAVPTVVTLINFTGEDAFIAGTPVQANIVITEVID